MTVEKVNIRSLRTSFTACHQKHGNVAGWDGGRAQTDDVSKHDRPPRPAQVKETLSGPVYVEQKVRVWRYLYKERLHLHAMR